MDSLSSEIVELYAEPDKVENLLQATIRSKWDSIALDMQKGSGYRFYENNGGFNRNGDKSWQFRVLMHKLPFDLSILGQSSGEEWQREGELFSLATPNVRTWLCIYISILLPYYTFSFSSIVNPNIIGVARRQFDYPLGIFPFSFSEMDHFFSLIEGKGYHLLTESELRVEDIDGLDEITNETRRFSRLDRLFFDVPE